MLFAGSAVYTVVFAAAVNPIHGPVRDAEVMLTSRASLVTPTRMPGNSVGRQLEVYPEPHELHTAVAQSVEVVAQVLTGSGGLGGGLGGSGGGGGGDSGVPNTCTSHRARYWVEVV